MVFTRPSLIYGLVSHGDRAINWTHFKRRFDAWMLSGMTTHLLAFLRGSTPALSADQSFTPVQVLTRATGSLAFLQLNFLLCIGPLARLTPSFKPFTHNRGHVGVVPFAVALSHAVPVTVWQRAFGVLCTV